MNNLFSASWRKDTGLPDGSVQMTASPGAAAGEANLDNFFSDVEVIKSEFKEIELAQRSLRESNETLKSLHSPTAVRDLRARMDADVARALKKAKQIKQRLEALERSDRSEPGSSAERTRTSVVSGLRKKLRDQMEAFGDLRRRVAEDHRDAVARQYYTVTGEKPDEATVEAMAAGGGEGILTAALAGRGELEATVAEMRERRGAVEELERSLLELHQVFLDMAVLVEEQGHQVDDIESQVGRARSYIDRGVKQLGVARRHQKNTRKWTCFGLLLLIIIILVIVLPIVLKN